MQQALDVLAYKREVLTQLLLVATIFGGFAVGGLMAFLGSGERGRLRSGIFVALAVSAAAFIAATALDAVMLPAMLPQTFAVRGVEAVSSMLALGDVVVWAVMAGCVALAGAVGASGFLFSRWVGRAVLGVTVLMAVIVSATIALFARVLG